MIEPKITVILPAYNAQDYIKEAIDSILNQTFRNFVLLIIDDASQDKTEAIIKSYSDERIVYLKNEINSGIAATLNRGIQNAKTEYIARMDADDIAIPDRLELQYEFMNTNRDISVCGTWYEIFGNEIELMRLPTFDEDIKASLLFGLGFCHPAIFFRTEFLIQNQVLYGISFSDNFGHKILELEDLDLWHRLKKIAKFANIDKMLLRYRKHQENFSTQKLDIIKERKREFYKRILGELNILPDDDILDIHISFRALSSLKSVETIRTYRLFLDQILTNNKSLHVYDQYALTKKANQIWERFFYFLPPLGGAFISIYSSLSDGLSTKQKMYLLKFKFNKFVGRK